MVSNWIAKNPLKIEERRKIKEGIDLGLSYGQIAISIDRAKSTIIRECKRLKRSVWLYDPDLAQADFEEKQRLIGIKKELIK